MAAQPAQQSLIIVCGSKVCVTVDFPSGAAQLRFIRHHALFALEMPPIQSVLGGNVNSNNSGFLRGLITKAERFIVKADDLLTPFLSLESAALMMVQVSNQKLRDCVQAENLDITMANCPACRNESVLLALFLNRCDLVACC